ncbi:MAG: hypothetical protein K1X83_11385 [Oligoflexia bacterium]|nr:hypothetical protein [Oligoflexia bacterium]
MQDYRHSLVSVRSEVPLHLCEGPLNADPLYLSIAASENAACTATVTPALLAVLPHGGSLRGAGDRLIVSLGHNSFGPLFEDAVTRAVVRTALAQLQLPVLHAAAVADQNNNAILLCGAQGIGKSTTAMALSPVFTVIADDNCPLIRDQSGFRTFGSGIFARLRADALAALGLRSTGIRVGDKQLVALGRAPSAADSRIRGVILLERGKQERTEMLSASESCFCLLPHLWSVIRGFPVNQKILEALCEFCAQVKVVRVIRAEAGTSFNARHHSSISSIVRALIDSDDAGFLSAGLSSK